MRRLLVAFIVFLGAVVVAGAVVAASPPARNFVIEELKAHRDAWRVFEDWLDHTTFAWRQPAYPVFTPGPNGSRRDSLAQWLFGLPHVAGAD